MVWIRPALVGAVLGLVVLVVCPIGPAFALSRTFASLDWMTLTSERIALVRIEAITDSVFPPPAKAIDRTFHFRVLRNVLGEGPSLGRVTEVAGWGSRRPPAGDTTLVFWQVRVDDSDPVRWQHRLALSGGRPPWLALTNDFGVVQSLDTALAMVERRVQMIRDGRPVGDDRPWSFRDFVQGIGCLTYRMPLESESQEATYHGGINYLRVPADADLLPSVLDDSRSSNVRVRVGAAWRLIHYGGPAAISRLREMLADNATVPIQAGNPAREVRVHAVRGQAYRALERLGVHAPRPPGFEADSSYLEIFED